jgi:predicted membrane-bound spermidine synthase
VSRPHANSAPHVRVQRTREGKFLYVDGSCASVWRPGVEVTGGSWDLLAAPALLVPGRAPRVLLLGVGGGTVIRVVRALCPEADIVGVDLDADVVAVARREFALDALGATIEIADAQRFLRDLPRGERFDVIVDDIYERGPTDMRKPAGWSATLRRAAARLRPGGVLVCNALDAGDARALSASLPPPAIALTHADYHNHILVGGRGLSPRQVGRTLRACALLEPTMRRTTIRALTASEPV